MPAKMLPPTARLPDSCGRACNVPDSRDNPRTLNTAISSRQAAPTSKSAVGTWRASDAVTLEPNSAPIVAPAAMKPNSRLPCSELKMSTISAQNTDTTNRLYTEIQMKNARPTQTVSSGSAKCKIRANSRIFAAKNR